MKENQKISTSLFVGIKQLIEQSRQKVAVAVNSEISMLYWHIGKRIKSDILNLKTAINNLVRRRRGHGGRFEPVIAVFQILAAAD